jgi:hypothetical protein
MKKLAIAAAILVVIGFLAKRFASGVGDIDWEKRFESMPDNAPPKWMFRNISEIHDNTERILELLDGSAGAVPGESESVAARHA